MSPAARIAAFATLLALVFAAAALAGSRVDPEVDEDAGHEVAGENGEERMNAHTETSDTTHGGGAAAESALPGLAVAQGGYRLELETNRLAAGERAVLRFRIADAAGGALEDFDVQHERPVHLIVVRRDFGGFRHLHPEREGDGLWSAPVDGLLPGVYRVFADFATGGESLTLGSDLFVPGEFEPSGLPAPAAVADAGDGYEVAIDGGDPHAGDTAPVGFTVSRDGRELDGVEPYLGADGHLVALRDGDLAFLHTHPEGEPGGRGPIEFTISYPSAGSYRLFLQFRHGGEVRTAAFTQEVAPTGGHGGAG